MTTPTPEELVELAESDRELFNLAFEVRAGALGVLRALDGAVVDEQLFAAVASATFKPIRDFQRSRASQENSRG